MRAIKLIKSPKGMSLIEVMIVTGIMAVLIVAMITMQTNQLKTTNYLDFQLKKVQLETIISGQVLAEPNNCACIFNGASAFPTSGTAALTGANPTQIAIFPSAAPGCGTPTRTFLDTTGIDGMKATSIQIQNIVPTPNPNSYSGFLNINVQTTKDVLGPKDLPISIPVAIATTPAGANVNFVSCSMTAGTGNTILANPGSASFPNGFIVKWGTFTVSNDSFGGTVNFVTPFPNGVFTVQVQSPAGSGNSQDNSATATGWNVNGFTWTNARDNWPIQGTYFATGY